MIRRHGDAEHVLHLDSHHIASDGWSRERAVPRAVRRCTRAAAGGAPPTLAAAADPVRRLRASGEREQLAGDRARAAARLLARAARRRALRARAADRLSAPGDAERSVGVTRARRARRRRCSRGARSSARRTTPRCTWCCSPRTRRCCTATAGQHDVARRLADRGPLASRDARADRLLRQHDRRSARGSPATRRSRSCSRSVSRERARRVRPPGRPVREARARAAGRTGSSATRRCSRSCSRCSAARASRTGSRLGDAEVPAVRRRRRRDQVRPHAVHVGARRRVDAHAARAARTSSRPATVRAHARPPARRARGGGGEPGRRACRGCRC